MDTDKKKVGNNCISHEYVGLANHMSSHIPTSLVKRALKASRLLFKDKQKIKSKLAIKRWTAR